MWGKCGFGLFTLDGAFEHMTDSFQWGPVGHRGEVQGFKRQGSGRDVTGGSFGLKHKEKRDTKLKKRGHTFSSRRSAVAAAPVPPSAPAAPGARVKLT